MPDSVIRLPAIAGRVPSLLSSLSGRPRHELEFLPAALEIVETPPAPAARAIPIVLCGLIAAAVAWSALGRVDVVASASGTIIPLGSSKTVQAGASGVVEQILVADGDHVAAGQPVIRLDSVADQANEERFATDFAEARLEVAGLRALRDDLGRRPGSTVMFQPPPGSDPHLAAQEFAAVEARWAEQHAKLANLTQQRAEKRVEATENAAAIDKLRASLPLLATVRDIYRKLYAAQLGSRIDLLAHEQSFSDAAHDLATQIAHGGEAASEAAALDSQYQATQADYARSVLTDLASAEQKTGELQAEYRAALHAALATVLSAPVSGTVQQLAVHSTRAAVTAFEPLMTVVPDDQRVIVEAIVSNRDIGWVRRGEMVRVKIEAFPFTRYGVISGQVIKVSHDALDDTPRDVVDQLDHSRSAGQDATGSVSGRDEAQGNGYTVWIALVRDVITVNGRSVRLGPGLSVTADIVTGRRRVISYLLSPLSDAWQNSAQER